MIDSITAIWMGCGFLAVYMLIKMMRNRQLGLIELLKKHVEIQSTWARRRDRALKIAATMKDNTEDTEASEAKIVNDLTSHSSEAA